MPGETYDNVDGIHLFSAHALLRADVWAMFNISGAANNFTPIYYDGHDPKHIGEVLKIQYEPNTTIPFPVYNVGGLRSHARQHAALHRLS